MSPKSQAYGQVEGLKIGEVPDGAVILRGDSNRLIFLNHTAYAVLLLFEGKATAEEVAEKIREIFNLSALPQADVDACVKSLLQEELIVPISKARLSSLLQRFLGGLRTLRGGLPKFDS
jgi:hypothetical protein